MNSHISPRRPSRIVGLAVAAILALIVAVPAYLHWSQPVFKDGIKLVAAVQAFARDRTAHGQPLPSSITLRELVRDGYIAADEVRAFEGMETTLSLTADERFPQQILMSARFPGDGGGIVVLGDGSVQQVTSKRLREMTQQ